ncbi:hypothetical protein [Streptomyces griseorubiginosus]|uniref:hypothetical protein n=1 Tax=Streptomyces griseorubiginosus TaxID=67304 RepID=UPI002E801058|nr:hypothetical protein [Streptomyces griseorubiginosus]WUB46245.1 hypothetical protein OHN19_24100 [Streptomyces griseorubiginosus]WUB54766.1 hypothetical protein OG942_24100 [Streptomyces griseorubiginosus]
MTQSGQGEQPSAREAREGIVLPSDGGEPLLPGQTGGYGTPQPGYGTPPQGGYGAPQQGGYGGSARNEYGGSAQADPSGPAPDAAYGRPSGGPAYAQPPGGQAWGTPWGPDQQQSQAQPPAQDWSQPTAQTWGTPQQPGGIPQSQPLPPQQSAPGYDTDEPTSYYLPPVGQPLPSAPAAQSQPLPPQQGQVAPYEAPGAAPAPQQPAQPAPGYDTDEPTSYYLPPVGQPLPSASGTPASAPLPPADEGATQFIPPVQAAAHEGATQYLPPVRPGALPPEAGHFPGQAPQHPQASYGAQAPGAGPLPPTAPTGPDAEATQFIAPVPGQAPGGDRQPPSDFDNLFRGQGTDAGAASTQQMPRFDRPEAAPPAYGGPQPSYGAQQPPYVPPGGDGYDDGGRGGRGRSRVPVIAAVGIGIVVLGIGAGALLAGGGGGDGGDKNQTVSATAPATDGSSAPAADPAKAQAVELDKLLADSGNSRSSVINAVADVKSCKNLPQAAQDLRAAASQRTGLVTRLQGVSVDRLPNHAELTDALTKAWQASASADNHYAAWADQAAGKKGCKKGQARTTPQTAAGNRDSGTASTEKARAARLWNAIAKKYSLTERSATQL